MKAHSSCISDHIRVGTRGSPLAVWQAERACLEVQDEHTIIKISTSGDQFQSGSLADIGGKGLFAKELDSALLDNAIDCAVQSLKDLETTLPKGIVIAAVLPRDDPRDALIGSRLGDLLHGASVATCSVRRAAQLRYLRPDLQIVPIRGSLQTRLQKFRDGLADATMLSYAGLVRLGMQDVACEVLPISQFIPAVGQGVIAVTIRQEDLTQQDIWQKIHCEETHLAITAERSMLSILDGSCHTPIGGYAQIINNTMTLTAVIFTPEGKKAMYHNDSITFVQNSDKENKLLKAQRLGENVGHYLQDNAADLFALSQKSIRNR